MNHTGKKIFVTGIDTGVGKTVVSAVLVRALKAAYWKPVQCGLEEGTDTERIRELSGESAGQIFPERFLLREAVSPHRAAEAEHCRIHLTDFSLPPAEGHLIVEGAGGVMAPLNETDVVVDIAARLGLSVVLVCRHYLGSLNHTLMSAECLRSRGLALNGLVFSGNEDDAYERFLSEKTGLPLLFRVPDLGASINERDIGMLAAGIRFPGVSEE
ncbi:MAG: dethiobiotin synthase [Deltaproteobacteria bacterium]|nr:dethiobiotin synthase [Deltaproteobacteria bacterium]